VEGVIVVDAPLGGTGVAAGCFGVHAEGVIVVVAVVVAAFDATPAVVGVGVVAVPAAGVVDVDPNDTLNITKINVIANIKRGIIRSPHATISAFFIVSHTINVTETSPNTKCSGILPLFLEKISFTMIPRKRAPVIIAG
jgi:hypothetical protein